MDKAIEAIIAHKSGESNEMPEQAGAGDSSVSFIKENGSTNKKGAFTNGRLVGTKEGTSLMVNGAAYVPGTIDGIENIKLIMDPGIIYDFTIVVDGACPKSDYNNKMTFTDESNDTYTLRIYSTTRKNHTVNYHSPAGAIKKITWDI
jgi:hypothetical protein